MDPACGAGGQPAHTIHAAAGRRTRWAGGRWERYPVDPGGERIDQASGDLDPKRPSHLMSQPPDGRKQLRPQHPAAIPKWIV